MKKLVTASILAAAVTAAHAQSSVTLYGTTGCGFFEMVEFVCRPRPGWVSERQGEIG